MKRTAKIFYFSAALLALTGCASNSDEKSAAESSESNAETAVNTSEKDERKAVESDTEQPSDASEGTEETAASNKEEIEQKKEDSLAGYSNKQIEYARIWLQLGANQEIDGLYVNKIPAGTQLNPDDETSGTYPEDVIQLAGSRLVDGSVTYSGNGDGTINVYNVPLRWDGQYPAGEKFYKEIIENTEPVAIDVGEDEEVIRLIELLEDQP